MIPTLAATILLCALVACCAAWVGACWLRDQQEPDETETRAGEPLRWS